MIREILDRAWGVKQLQHKKKDEAATQPTADDPFSQKALLMEPIGQDITKKRYWVVDSAYLLYRLIAIALLMIMLIIIYSASFLPSFGETTLFAPADSPRLYTSTNPWKVASAFKTVASNKDEYIKTLEDLKLEAPLETQEKKSKLETTHINLITLLEKRLEDIDAELAVSVNMPL